MPHYPSSPAQKRSPFSALAIGGGVQACFKVSVAKVVAALEAESGAVGVAIEAPFCVRRAAVALQHGSEVG